RRLTRCLWTSAVRIEPQRLCRPEARRQEAWEHQVGLTELLLAGHEVVERSVDGAQTARQLRVRDLVGSRTEKRSTGGVILRHEDLFIDEPQVAGSKVEPLADRGGLLLRVNGRLEYRTSNWRQGHCDHHRDGPAFR